MIVQCVNIGGIVDRRCVHFLYARGDCSVC